MILIREIPRSEVTDSQLICLAEVGFILKDRGDTVEVWAYEMAVV